MIELGMHTDNWRPLSGNFRAAVDSAVKYELSHIEFGVIHGQYFINGLGYDPAVSLQSNPRALRRYLDQKGLRVSQIDGAYPLMGPDGSTFGVQYIQQAIRFAAEVGCPIVDTTDGAFKTEPIVKRILDEVGNGGLGVHTETQACQRDAQLGSGYIAIGGGSIIEDALDPACLPVTLLDQLLYPGRSHANDRKLGSHKQTVDQNQNGDGKEGKDGGNHEGTPVSGSGVSGASVTMMR